MKCFFFYQNVVSNGEHVRIGETSKTKWKSNYIHHKVWDEITYPIRNFNGCTVEVWEKDKQFHPTLYNGCNYLSMLGLKLNHVSKRAPSIFGHQWFRVIYVTRKSSIKPATKKFHALDIDLAVGSISNRALQTRQQEDNANIRKENKECSITVRRKRLCTYS